jgi:hypothetical protein
MRALSLILLGVMGAAGLWAADGDDLTQAQIDDIITQFAAKEAAFAQARENYTYRQTARIQELDTGGNTIGRWEMVSDIIFDTTGKRNERVVRAPVPSLKNILLTPEDLEDMRNVQPFVLTTRELPKYLIRYLGKETLDEIPTYSFAVKPKKLEPGERYFSGIVWVDDRDLQIVKTYGRAVGIVKVGSAFPKFETYREQVDGVYWFPTYTIAEDTLHFPDFDQRIRQVMKYEDYKQFRSTSTITFGDEVDVTTEQEPVPPPPAKPKP